MIVVSLVLPLVGVYGIIMFHPWIDWIMEVWHSSREDHGALVGNVASITSGDDGGAFYNVSLVEKDDSLVMEDLPMMEDWRQEWEEEVERRGLRPSRTA